MPLEITSWIELLLPKEYLQTFFSAPTDVPVGMQNRRFLIFPFDAQMWCCLLKKTKSLSIICQLHIFQECGSQLRA